MQKIGFAVGFNSASEMDCFYQELEKFSSLDYQLSEIEVPENLDKKTGHKLLKQCKDHQT